MKRILTSTMVAVAIVCLAGLPSPAPPRSPAPSPTKAFVASVAPAAAVSAVATPRVGAPSAGASAVDAARAHKTLDRLRHQYRYLDGVTVRMATTPKDEQAVAYYTLGQIIIDPSHSASIEKILAHEIWHIIDWRDNGRFDWGENLPPSNASQYSRKL